MYLEPWLPLKFALLPDLQSGPVLHAGDSFQIIRTIGAASQALLVAPDVAQGWSEAGLIDSGQCDTVSFGEQSWALLTSDERHLVPVQSLLKPDSKSDALGFADAFRRSREKAPQARLAASVYCERLAVLLPLPEICARISDDVLLGRFLTGGVEVSCHESARISTLAPWISADDLRQFCAAAGLAEQAQAVAEPPNFSLPGRVELEAFLREHIIEIVQHSERYRALGIDFPSAIVLHGPPGSGKTFAVETLVKFLNWPCLQVDSGSIGSPYIHATGQKIAEIFSLAMHNAPAVIVIDEMEAYLGDRNDIGPHRVEEVAEFLRRIPEAQKNRVLVIGMTNRLDKIDKAVLRRGRFDHIIKVDLPTEQEAADLLRQLLAARPCEESISLNAVVRHLAGKPLSEVTYFVREASRLTAKVGKTKIDDISIAQALRAVVGGAR